MNPSSFHTRARALTLTPVLLLCLAGVSLAADLTGKVTQVTGNTAQIAIDGDFVPTSNDAVSVFFKIPGSDDEVLVANGRVTAVEGGLATVEIKETFDDVAVNQLARVTSPNPQRKISIGSSPSPTASVPATTGRLVLSDNFDAASTQPAPLFGDKTMTWDRVAGEGRLVGKAAGVLPVLYPEVLLRDFILECDLRTEKVPAAARFGIVFRSARIKAGAIAHYYSLWLDPNTSAAGVDCLSKGKWATVPRIDGASSPVPIPDKIHLRLEVSGQDFAVAINGKPAGQFRDGTITGEGIVGFFIAGVEGQEAIVNFDNLRLHETTQTQTLDSPTPPRRDSTRAFSKTWDFSAGNKQGTRSQHTDIVDGKVWKMKGSHMRFLAAGKTWLEARFTVPVGGGSGSQRLTVRHLSSSPDGKQMGNSPVRIRLNGTTLFEGSPSEMTFLTQSFDLAGALRDGENVLRWDFLDKATTHYWLKSFSLSE